MLVQFPTPYPDELLYGVFARYKVRAGHLSPKAVLRDLFSRMNAIATIDLPCGIDQVLNNIVTRHDYTPVELIYRHTLFPFYQLGSYKERIDKAFDTMRGNTGGNIHNVLGIMASTVPLQKTLVFCPTCISEDKRQRGEGYWHRVHHVPGVLVCPLHGDILQRIEITSVTFNRHEYIEANDAVCTYEVQPIRYNSKTVEKLYILAHQMSFILDGKCPYQKPDWFREQYIYVLQNKGLAAPSGRVSQQSLYEEFICYYGEELLQAIGCYIDRNNDQNWLASLTRKSINAIHPLHHVLMMVFLAGGVSSFYNAQYSYKPFGSPPWPCLNAAADHYLNDCIDTVDISYDHKVHKVVGTFTCDCGFIYARSGPDTCGEDRFRIGRIKKYGEVWMNRLRSLLSGRKLSMREIARQMNADVGTIIRYSKLEERTDTTAIVVAESKSEIEEAYKEKWLLVRNNHPEVSIMELRTIIPGVYVWLYRHCRGWLRDNSPLPRKEHSSICRVNWAQRDEELLPKLRQAVQSLRSESRRSERITITKIGYEASVAGLLQKNLDKLPLCKNYLSTVTETIEEYKVRKLYSAADTLRSEGQLVRWRLLKLAGVKENEAPVLDSSISNILESSYSTTCVV